MNKHLCLKNEQWLDDKLLKRLDNIEAGLQELLSKLPKQQKNENDFMLVEEAVSILGVNRQTVYRLISSGMLKAFKRTKRNYILRSDLDDFITRGFNQETITEASAINDLIASDSAPQTCAEVSEIIILKKKGGKNNGN